MAFEQELRDAMSERRFVRVECEAFEGEFVGLVQGLGDTLLSVALLDDRVRMGGVDVLRLEDVSDVEFPAPHVDFYESALRLRGEASPEPDTIDLSSIRTVLESVAKLTPLTVIHREGVELDVCEIGQVVEFEAEHFGLREIDPDADWYDEVTQLSYAEVTRVGYGGDYEAALALVAGIVS